MSGSLASDAWQNPPRFLKVTLPKFTLVNSENSTDLAGEYDVQALTGSTGDYNFLSLQVIK